MVVYGGGHVPGDHDRRVGYRIAILDPENPTGGRAEATLALDVMSGWHKHSLVRWKNLEVGKWVLEHPARIFAGVREYDPRAWYCYVAKPESWWIRPDVRAPFPRNLVYAVYLNSNLRWYEHRE